LQFSEEIVWAQRHLPVSIDEVSIDVGQHCSCWAEPEKHGTSAQKGLDVTLEPLVTDDSPNIGNQPAFSTWPLEEGPNSLPVGAGEPASVFELSPRFIGWSFRKLAADATRQGYRIPPALTTAMATCTPTSWVCLITVDGADRRWRGSVLGCRLSAVNATLVVAFDRAGVAAEHGQLPAK
jgi:hypothetical protein